MAMLSPARGYVREAYLVFVERALATVSRDLLRLSGAGLEVDIADHIEITRRLAAGSGNFTQIQRRAFLVPDEWTQDWMRLVSTLPSTGTRCAYVVLMDRAEAASQMDKLDSMDRFLTKAGWSFEYCDLRDVLDSLGGVLPTEWNLDVFEGKVAKLQESPAGRYQGGVRLRMTMFDLQQEPDLRRFVDSVGTFARPHSTAGTARRPNPGSTRQRRR
jgi:hypothetical protein